MLNDSFKTRYRALPIASSRSVGFAVTHPHNHGEFEILAIDSGSSEIRAGSVLYPVNAGDLIFINPMEVHSVVAEKSSDYRHRCICFDTSLIGDESLADSLRNESSRVMHFTDSESPHASVLRHRFNEIFDAVEKSEKTAKMEIPALITLMFSYLLKNSLITDKSSRENNSGFCRKILDYISENYRESITSKQVSEALSYNQSYFCRVFRTNFGLKFSDYLNMYRISMSRKYLEEDMSISDVAASCGFSSPEYFTRLFKKQYGISPSHYKKSI